MLRRGSSRRLWFDPGTLVAQTTRNQPICMLSAKPARPWALAWGGKRALTNPTIGSAGYCARGERADVADSVVMIAAPL
jgi:hypothetical protein